MTIEERFERIEHITAGLAEEQRRDYEENRQLWRETQRQLSDLAVRVNDLASKIADTNDTIVRVDAKLADRIARLAEESHTADQKLGERLDALVSAIGRFITK